MIGGWDGWWVELWWELRDRSSENELKEMGGWDSVGLREIDGWDNVGLREMDDWDGVGLRRSVAGTASGSSFGGS